MRIAVFSKKNSCDPHRKHRGPIEGRTILNPLRHKTFKSSALKNVDFFFKKHCFPGRIWPDWGKTIWADLAGLGVYRDKWYVPIGGMSP